MKVLILDATTSNYSVKYCFANATNVTETVNSNGSITVSWNDPTSARITHTFTTDNEEVITVDDTVQVNVGDPAPAAPLLQKVQSRKNQELINAYNQAISADFTDTGTGFTFGVDTSALINFALQATDILYCPEDYPSGTNIFWNTRSNGVQALTLTQFKGVCKSLRQHLRDNIQKLWNLQNQVNQATTVAQVKAVTWG